MKRLGLFHMDGNEGTVYSYVTYLLDELAKNVDHLVIISSGSLREESMKRLTSYTYDVFVCASQADDSTAYKELFTQHYSLDKLRQFDELVLVNDSCYGPLYSLAQVFDEMEQRNADFWGITNQYPCFNPLGESSAEKYLPYHILSNFLVVRSRLLHSEDFMRFWDSLLKYEVWFTSYFMELGYTCDSFIDTIALTPREADCNLLHMNHNAFELIEQYKCPFIKRECFSIPLDETLRLSVGADMRRIMDYIRLQTNYDEKLVWDHLLCTYDMSDLHDVLHLDYILPSLVENTSGTKQKRKKTVVIAHLHYPELVERCFSYLANISSHIDLIITTKMVETKEKIEACIPMLNRHNYRVIMSTNRGREISSLLVSCKEYLMEYEYLCFVHDKKVTSDLGIPKIGQVFMDLLWESMLKSQAYIDNVLNCFDENPRLGLLAPPPPYHSTYLSSGVESWTRSFAETVKLAERLNLNCKLSMDKRPFVLGTAFWCRTSAMKALFEYDLEYEDFPQEPLPGDGSMNHAIERIFPYVAQREGYYSGLVMPIESASLHLVNYRYLFANMLRSLRQGTILNNYGTAVDLQDLLSVKVKEEGFQTFYRKHSRILLYGTGEIAERFVEDFQAKGLVFEGFIVSDGRRTEPQLWGHQVYELSEVEPSDDMGIILAISRYNQKQVLPLLSERGHMNLYSIYT